jgi:hypothetical protein
MREPIAINNADDPRLARFYAWRKRLEGVEDGDRDGDRAVEEWIFLNAAPVLLADKTGELLSLSLDEFPLSAGALSAVLESFAASWGCAYRVLSEGNGTIKFIVYDRVRLQRVLDDAPYCVMGAKLHYAFPLRADGFVAELQARWARNGQVPHEIGVALGYPLDDVFGYMGLLPLPCKGVCGWRVYGCLHESRRRSCAFNNARCQALVFLAKMSAAPAV